MKTKDVDPNKISTSGEVYFGMIAFLVFIWSLVQIILLLITINLLAIGYIGMTPGTIILMLSLLPMVAHCTGQVKMNRARVLLNTFNKKARAVFQGFYFKFPWEEIAYEIDLEGEIEAKIIEETFPTYDGGVIASSTILSKVDSGEGKDERTRSKLLINHVKYETEVKETMLATRAKEVMRNFFSNITIDEALRTDSSKIINHATDFRELEELLSLAVKESPVYDIDLTKESQNARDSKAKGDALRKIAKKFKALGVEPKEAMNFAALLNKDISVEKKIHEINVNGLNLPKPAIDLFIAFAKKMGGTK